MKPGRDELNVLWSRRSRLIQFVFPNTCFSPKCGLSGSECRTPGTESRILRLRCLRLARSLIDLANIAHVPQANIALDFPKSGVFYNACFDGEHRNTAAGQ